MPRIGTGHQKEEIQKEKTKYKEEWIYGQNVCGVTCSIPPPDPLVELIWAESPNRPKRFPTLTPNQHRGHQQDASLATSSEKKMKKGVATSPDAT